MCLLYVTWCRIVGSTKQNGARFQASRKYLSLQGNPSENWGNGLSVLNCMSLQRSWSRNPMWLRSPSCRQLDLTPWSNTTTSNGKKVKTVKIRPGEEKVWDRVSWPQMNCILQISVLESLEDLRPNIWLIPTTLNYDALSLSCKFAEPGNMVRAKIVFFPL